MGLIRSLAFCLFVALLTASPASAAITASSISAPASGSELFYDGDQGTGSVTVRGTVTGATAGAKGDLLCYSVSDTKWTVVASGIDVSSGSFATNVSLFPIAGFACRLAMVPSGHRPMGDPAAVFAGPAISVSDRFSHSSSGNMFGWYVLTGSLDWSFALQSIGECPINSSFATEEGTLSSYSLFVGNSCLPQSSGEGPAAGTRSALMIDGLNAYPPAAISNLTSQPGFEPLSYSAEFDPNHDAVIINDTEIPTICDPPATFPPTAMTCPSLHDSGIEITQTTAVLDQGQVARVTQRFTSVDGRSHQIDALFGESVAAQSAGESPGFQFPGQGSFATQATPYSFSSFPAGPGSIIVISDPSFLPTTSNPIGAITFNRPPVSADFVSAKGAETATFLMHYSDTVPAGGSVVYDWSYSQSSSNVGLATLEATERDRFGNPTVTIGSPRNGLVTRNSSVRVQGQVFDAVGVISLSVGGHGVVVRPNGIFGTDVSLRPGKNVIPATVTNLAGNTGSATITVTYKPPPCRVPRLRGKTLAAARRALLHAGCAIGKIKRVRSSTVRKGRVISTTPAPGTKHRNGYKVRLEVSRGR